MQDYLHVINGEVNVVVFRWCAVLSPHHNLSLPETGTARLLGPQECPSEAFLKRRYVRLAPFFVWAERFCSMLGLLGQDFGFKFQQV